MQRKAALLIGHGHLCHNVGANADLYTPEGLPIRPEYAAENRIKGRELEFQLHGIAIGGDAQSRVR